MALNAKRFVSRLTRDTLAPVLAGGLEVLGEMVLTSPEEKARLDDGSIGYAGLEAALASLCTPLDDTRAPAC